MRSPFYLGEEVLVAERVAGPGKSREGDTIARSGGRVEGVEQSDADATIINDFENDRDSTPAVVFT